MKIAISSTDGNKDSQFSPRFGRCEYFLFVDTDTKVWETVTNPAAAASGGAGGQVAQFLSGQNVDVTISGRYGPTAFSALQAAGIQCYQASGGTPSALLEKYLSGGLQQVNQASGPGRHRSGR